MINRTCSAQARKCKEALTWKDLTQVGRKFDLLYVGSEDPSLHTIIAGIFPSQITIRPFIASVQRAIVHAYTRQQEATKGGSSLNDLIETRPMPFVLFHARSDEGRKPSNDLIAKKKVFLHSSGYRAKLRWIQAILAGSVGAWFDRTHL